MILRRDFIKKTGLFIISAPFWNLLLPEISTAIQTAPKYKDPVLQLIQPELNAFPYNSIAHSIEDMEFIFYPNSLRSLWRGLSVKGQKVKFFVFKIEQRNIIKDHGFRRKFIYEAVKKINTSLNLMVMMKQDKGWPMLLMPISLMI